MTGKIKVLFICHGNICRSPMAEFYMKDLVKRKGLEDEFEIASKATSTEELGSPVYPPVREKLAEYGISCDGKTASQLKKRDYDNWDYLIVMDNYNFKSVSRIIGSDPDGKVRMMLEFAGRDGESVADPWYTRDFESTWRDVSAGCNGLLEFLLRKGIL